MKPFSAIILIVTLGVHEVYAQRHITSSDVAGNYSGIFFGTATRSGLRSGWDTIPDTMESRSSEFMLLSTVFVPVAGDITESPTFALGLEIPYSSKRLTQNGQQSAIGGSRAGIGDIALVAKYGFTVYEEFELASEQRLLKARVDLIGKIKFPSGESHSNDAQGIVLPHHLQLGSGSTDYALGFAFLTETEKYFMIHGHAMYWLNMSANGYKAGNNFNYEIAFILATLPIDAEPVGTFLPYIGVKGMHSTRDEMDGMEINNSGGDVAALSIGVQSLWVYIQSIGTFLMVDASYQLPFVQRLNGVQMGYGASFNAGVRVYVK
jgi:hypothetical protein